MKSRTHQTAIPRAAGSLTLILCLWLASTSLAFGHAHLERQTPAPGTTLKQPPPVVKLVFSEPLEPAFSTLEITDGQGARVNRGDSHVAADNPRLLVAPLTRLEPGTYSVSWHVVSVDGHTTEGDYRFHVAP